MSMSKKDYIRIGEVLKHQLERQPFSADRVRYTHEVIDELCVVFRADNPNFKEQRFRDFIAGKCGPNGGAR